MHPLLRLAVATAILSLPSCARFHEPDWLAQARSLEKQKRPLCTRLNGALHELDKRVADVSSQREFERQLAAMRSHIDAAVADCRARNSTY